ncbi:hypothetical protein GWI33_020411 [Rhynchophorus ferrugineus]|uniref:Uncharacterized protein n=1 Tax=Rhynchophorus ferrugineus TaxID=354439 RepID=A0A834HUD4_RHYFE|nr:hypothetical protein GWI33_020411 [Rhynchophorus ferrugineus]
MSRVNSSNGPGRVYSTIETESDTERRNGSRRIPAEAKKYDGDNPKIGNEKGIEKKVDDMRLKGIDEAFRGGPILPEIYVKKCRLPVPLCYGSDKIFRKGVSGIGRETETYPVVLNGKRRRHCANYRYVPGA